MVLWLVNDDTETWQRKREGTGVKKARKEEGDRAKEDNAGLGKEYIGSDVGYKGGERTIAIERIAPKKGGQVIGLEE